VGFELDLRCWLDTNIVGFGIDSFHSFIFDGWNIPVEFVGEYQ
jgi:hypothetical protein